MVDRTASSLTNTVTVLRTTTPVCMYASMTFVRSLWRAVKHARVHDVPDGTNACNDQDLSLLHRPRSSCVALHRPTTCLHAPIEITVVVGRQARRHRHRPARMRHAHRSARGGHGTLRGWRRGRRAVLREREAVPVLTVHVRGGNAGQRCLHWPASPSLALARLHARAGGTTDGHAGGQPR